MKTPATEKYRVKKHTMNKPQSASLVRTNRMVRLGPISKQKAILEACSLSQEENSVPSYRYERGEGGNYKQEKCAGRCTLMVRVTEKELPFKERHTLERTVSLLLTARLDFDPAL